MRAVLPFCFILILSLCVSANADFSLVGKIPAPNPWPYCCAPMSGLAIREGQLFVVASFDTSSYLFLLDPTTGDVIESVQFTEDYGQEGYPHFSAAAYEGLDHYWITDDWSGDFLKVEWGTSKCLGIIDQWDHHRISNPIGLAHDECTTLWATDMDKPDSVFKLDIYGNITAAYAYDVCGPMSGIALYGENLLLASMECLCELYEVTKDGDEVEMHELDYCPGGGPMSITFHDGLLYVGMSYSDSIFIYEPDDYNVEVPGGDSVAVEPVPEGLEVVFEHVSDPGSLYVEVLTSQPCPPPGGVEFFGDFYEIIATAAFDYISEVALLTDSELPEGVAAKKVRVFERASSESECPPWRDITVEPVEFVEPPGREGALRVITRTRSEDDEFSVFVLGEDNRNPLDVISLKCGYLEDEITAFEDSIPAEVFARINALLDWAKTAFMRRRVGRAAFLVNRIAEIVRDETAIPHTFDPDGPGVNVAGRIMSRAHTLVFSLELLLSEWQFMEPLPPGTRTPPTDASDPLGAGLSDVWKVTPNPFSSEVAVEFSHTGDQPVSVSVFSVRGKLVRTLLEGAGTSGRQQVIWDGRNGEGIPVAAGTYFVVLRRGEQTAMSKVVLRR